MGVLYILRHLVSGDGMTGAPGKRGGRYSPLPEYILNLLRTKPATRIEIYETIHDDFTYRWLDECLRRLVNEKKVERVAVNGEMKRFLYRLKVKG